ncbi:hypothetical protein CR105_07345 [Massilia eurypsychrophila]|jgi:hypothetical protein|uniref:Uncharacterized protein n=1 Tax=Massilia eurypsychrophila TaxID=1485217 RepID=A0A2G8TIK7_9BURK|nr:hypothetical protein [Massilia eurypsychrophila]PIL45863.1 hypothetical protein CR105_07345 [Massilia eurypsychrophila]
MKPLLLALALLCPPVQGSDYFTRIEPKPLAELWLASGFGTLHFKRDNDLNGANVGIGAEYRLRGDMTLTAGRFSNSDRENSTYLGAIWQPYAIGPLRLGVVVAAFNGYPRMRGGGWFPAALPVATLEYQRFGVNFGFVPSYKERLYGGLSVQLKLRLID